MREVQVQVKRKRWQRKQTKQWRHLCTASCPMSALYSATSLFYVRTKSAFRKKWWCLKPVFFVSCTMKGFVMKSQLSTSGCRISTCFADSFISGLSISLSRNSYFSLVFPALLVCLSEFLQANLCCNVKYWFRKALDVNSSKSKGSRSPKHNTTHQAAKLGLSKKICIYQQHYQQSQQFFLWSAVCRVLKVDGRKERGTEACVVFQLWRSVKTGSYF